MTQDEIINAIMSSAEMTRPEARKTLKAIVNVIANEMALGREVNIQSFGEFGTRLLPPRPGHNPRTEAPLILPAEIYPTFQPFDPLFEALN